MSDSCRFELDTELPCPHIRVRTERLIGFDARYARIERDLHLLMAPEEIRHWSKKKHGRELPVCTILEDRYPMVIFHGDVGTGKTATAEGIADRLARNLEREARLLKLSTRVRGSGLHGEMSKLIGEAFDVVIAAAGQRRLAFLLIDEADAVAASREGTEIHQEERAGTNTLIQKIDDLRKLQGRALVLLCTNRLRALDPAIVRRAARLEAFERPSDEERLALFQRDLAGVNLDPIDLRRLVEATGPDPQTGRPGLSYSDIRARLLPAAVAAAFPHHPLTAELLLRTAQETPPSPPMV